MAAAEGSLDAATFHAKVYQIVRLIPPGRCTSYGHIAKLIGMPRHSRMVGQALKFLEPGSDIPWQRVVGSTGTISSRGPGTDGAARQRARLEEEGVEVLDGGRVKWATVGWFPESVDLEDRDEEDEEE